MHSECYDEDGFIYNPAPTSGCNALSLKPKTSPEICGSSEGDAHDYFLFRVDFLSDPHANYDCAECFRILTVRGLCCVPRETLPVEKLLVWCSKNSFFSGDSLSQFSAIVKNSFSEDRKKKIFFEFKDSKPSIPIIFVWHQTMGHHFGDIY